MRITSSDKLEKMTSWNVVGELPGTEHPEEIILIGSHYDGHDISQGASDPASGVVSVLEAARVLGKYAQLPRTVRFVMWGVEEIGLLGSQAYVIAHADELHKIRFYLNMDAAGGMAIKDINLHAWPELQDTFEKYRAEMALDFAIGQSFHSASDHYSLLLKGVITGGVEPVRQTMGGRGYGHTQFDTVDKVDLQGLRDAASLAARIVLRVVLEENWPAIPRDTSAVDQLLNQPARAEIMKHLAEMAEYHGKREFE
jgi:Zn-dependent M28 family amino/carboxypeptidase